MTTKTYDNDPLGILDSKGSDDPLGILSGDEKKKETSSGRGLIALAGAGAASPTGTENTPQSTSQLQLDIEGIFEFGKQRKRPTATIPANIPQAKMDVQKSLSRVENGIIDKQELSDLYETDYGKPVVESLIDKYAPQLGKFGWDKEVFRNEEKWDELSKIIKTKNRTNAAIKQENIIKGIDDELKNAFENYKTEKITVTGGTGGASININSIPLPNINVDNPWEYGRVIEQLKSSDKVIGKDGKTIEGKKEQLIQFLKEKAKYFISKQGIDADVNFLSDKIDQAVIRANLNRELGENIPTEDFAKNDALNQEHFKIGLSYLKNVQPGRYKNILRVIESGKSLPDDDFRTAAEIGQEIYNQKVFIDAAKNPELIDKETDFDYTTRSDKKAQYAAIIGERLKASGRTNRREFSEDEIKKAAFDLPNKTIVNELAREEQLFGYDAIPKSGSVEALVQGLNIPLDGIRSTYELFSESPVETYIRSKKLDTGSAQKVVDEEGQVSNVLPSDRGNIYYDAIRGLGQFIPQVLLTKGIGGTASGIVGMDARLALSPALQSGISTYGGTAISTFLQTYGDSYADYLQKTGDAAIARLAGTIDGGVSAAFELLLPDVKIADKAFAGLRGGLSTDIISMVRKGGDPATLAKNARPFVQKYVANVLDIARQEVSEEVGTQLVDFITESVFSPQTAKDRDLGKELLETVKATAVSMALPSLLGGAGAAMSPDFTKSTFTAAAINFDDYKQSLEKSLNNDGINQEEYNAAIKLLTTHRNSINDAPKQDENGAAVPGQKQMDYAYEDTKIKVYKEKATNSEGVAKEMWENKIKQSENIQREILMPKTPVQTAVVESEIEQPIITSESAIEPVVKTGEIQPDQIESELLSKLKENAPDVQKSENIQYFIDKSAEDPAAFMDVHGKKVTKQLLEKVPTEKLVENRDYLVKNFGESESTDFLTQIISQRGVTITQPSIQPEGAAENVVPSTLDIPLDLQERGEEIISNDDAKSRFSNGERIFGFSEQDGNAVELLSVEDMDKYAPDQLLAYSSTPKQDVVSPVESTSLIDRGTVVSTQEPAPVKGRTPVTLSGSTEQERQATISKRKSETFLPGNIVDEQKLLSRVNSYNKKSGIYKRSVAGRSELNNIKTAVGNFNKTHNKKYTAQQNRAGDIEFKTSEGKKVKTNNRSSGDLSIDEKGVPLLQRSEKINDVFNQMLERDVFPTGYTVNGSRMDASQLEGTIQDILDGIPSRAANNYLDNLEKQIEADDFDFTTTESPDRRLMQRVNLDTILGTKKEQQGEPMTVESLEAWLNEQGELTQEQEQIVIDNIENLIEDYEPETTTPASVQQTEPTTETTTGEQAQPDTESKTQSAETAKTTPVAETKQTEVKPTVDSLTNELRGLLGGEGLAFKDVSNKDIKEGGSKNIQEYNQRAERVLKTLYPNAEFKALRTTKEYEQETGRKGEAGVLIRGKDGKHKLFLNLESIINNDIERTATHEVVHAIVSDAIGVKYADLRKKWDNLLPKLYNVKGFEIVKEHIEKYTSADRPVEGITDLIANIVHNKIKIDDIPKNLWDEFIEFVNRAFEAIGLDYKITPDTFNGFASSVKEAFDTGDFTRLKKFTSKSKTEKFFDQYPEFAESASAMIDPEQRNKTIKEFIKNALGRGASEADIKTALINNGISDADAQAFIDDSKPQPQPQAKPKTSGTARTDNEVIATVLSQRVDARTFPTIFDDTDTAKQIAAITQGIGQNRIVDGEYVRALQTDLREVSMQAAKLLRDQLGADWGLKTLTWIEQNPSNGNLAQVVGVLNIISADNYQDIQNTHDSNKVRALQVIQNRIDKVSLQRARDSSLALNQRRLYVKFAQGDPIADGVADTILTPEVLQLKEDIEAVLADEVTDDQINQAPPLKTNPKQSAIRKVTGAAKRKSNPSLKDELMNKGAETANKTKKTFKELINDANDKLKNIKC